MQTRKGAWSLFVVVIGVALLGLGFYLGGRMLARKRAQTEATLSAEREAAKRENLPLEPDDLNRKPPVPDAQNAAPLYRKIADTLKAAEKGDEEEKSVHAVRTGKATDADRRSARKYLSFYAPQMALAQQAAALPDCDFHRDWKQEESLQFPEPHRIVEIVRLFVAQAVLQSETGHFEEAMHSLELGARITRHIGQEPTMMSLLIQISLEATLDAAWQIIVKANAQKPDVLERAAQVDAAFGALPDLRNALRGEFVVRRVMLKEWRENGIKLDVKLLMQVGQGDRQKVFDAYEVRLLIYWRRLLAALDKAQGDPLATYQAMKSVGETEKRTRPRIGAAEGLSGVLNGGSVPLTAEVLSENLNPTFFTRNVLKVVECAAKRNLRQTFLALLNYRQANGRFPEGLAALSPAPPLDPFSGQPFLYNPTEQGFILYSVGENFQDDGGISKSDPKSKSPLDIVIRYP